MPSSATDISSYIYSRLTGSFSTGATTWNVYNHPPNSNQRRYVWWAMELLDDIDLGTKEKPIYPYEVEFTFVERVDEFFSADEINLAVKYVLEQISPRATNLTSGDHQLISTRKVGYSENTEETGRRGDTSKLLVRKLIIRILAEEL